MPCNAKQLQGAAICNRRLLACAFALLSAITSNVFGQDAVPSGLRWRDPSGEFEVAVMDKYIYNGYVIQDQGPIVQPYFEIAEEFWNGSGFLSSASATFSLFGSFQSREDGAGHTSAPGSWLYEIQVNAGLEFVLGKQLTVDLSYVRFESPINAYVPANAVELKLTWNDKNIPGWFSVKPHVTWLAALPFRWSADQGDGNYFEIGIEHEWTLPKTALGEITLKVPVTIGLGDDRYYPGDRFGYAALGVSASTPLPFLGDRYGKWTLAVTGTYYRLGNAPAELSNDGDRNQAVVSLTLSSEFGADEE
jgi:hypothetical protein